MHSSVEMSDNDIDSRQKRKRKFMVFEETSGSSEEDERIFPSGRKNVQSQFEESADSDCAEDFVIRKKKKVTRGVVSDSEYSDEEIVRRIRRSNCHATGVVYTSSSSSDSDSGSSESDNMDEKTTLLPKTQDDESASSDFSDTQAEKCPICLVSFKKQQVGLPDICSHKFCADCIEEWSKTVNTCPVDRKIFTWILVKDCSSGDVVKRIPVQEPTSNRLGEDELFDPSSIDTTCCEVCGSSVHEDRLLLCDRCDFGYHLYCLNPPLMEVPDGEWYCPTCRQFTEEAVVELERLWDGETEELGILDALHLRNNALRLVPRTRQTERIRSRIAQQRNQNNRSNTNVRADPLSQSGPSTSQNRTTRKRAKKYKRKCKKSRRTPRYKIVYEVDEKTGEKIAIKTKTRKYRKRRKTKRRKLRIKRVVIPKTVKKRLAAQLGICPPKKIGQTLPDIKVSHNSDSIENQRNRAGVRTLHLFGQRDELDYFTESDVDIAEEGLNVLVARRPNMSDAALVRRAVRNKMPCLPSSTSVSQSVDVLGSILDSQANFYSKNSNISVSKDGTLIINSNKNRASDKLFHNNFKNINDTKVCVRQTPMSHDNVTNNTLSTNNSGTNNSRGDEVNYNRTVSTSSVATADNSSNNFRERGEENDTLANYCMPLRDSTEVDIPKAQKSAKTTNDSDKPFMSSSEENSPFGAVTPNSDGEVDIYSDIETVGNNKLDDVNAKYTFPPSIQMQSMIGATEDDNESDVDLVIDTENVESDKYDPAIPLDSDNEDQTKEEAMSSKPDHDHKATTCSSEKLYSSIYGECRIQNSENIVSTDKPKDFKDFYGDNEPIDDCPNFNIYSSESINLAKHTEFSMAASTNVDSLNPPHSEIYLSGASPGLRQSPDNMKSNDESDQTYASTGPSQSSENIKSDDDTQQVVVGTKPGTAVKKQKLHAGLYSDSEDETIVKIDPQQPFGIGDLRSMTEDISEEERSYTPCLDEKALEHKEGLEGLETEMISDDDKNDFDETQEVKTVSDGDALEINAKESELDFTRPEDCEEGEIIDKLKSKKEEIKNKETSDEKLVSNCNNSNETNDVSNKENIGKESSFKKLSKSNRERNYRDKEKERSKSKEKKDKSTKENKKERKREKRKEIERYNVRSIIAEKPSRGRSKDRFGRDPACRQSRSNSSKSGASPEKFGISDARKRSKSRSSRSFTPPCRFGREGTLKRSLSASDKSQTSHQRSFSRGNKSHSKERKRNRSRGYKSPVRGKSHDRRRSRSRPKRRRLSSGRDRPKRKSRERSKLRRKARSHSRPRSFSPRRRDWNKRQSRGWTPSLSRTRSPEPLRHASPSWTPPRILEKQPVKPQNLTVILTNSANKKRKDKKKKTDKKSKDSSEKQKRRRYSDRSPVPSKEVFTSGNNILVSVSFNKETEERDVTTRKRNSIDELTTKRMRKEKEKRSHGKITKQRNRRNKNMTNVKPVAIIDLDRSPFRELTPSPKDIIVLSDSEENGDSNDLLGLQKALCDSSQQATSPEHLVHNSYVNGTGPKTPPEPQVKFSLNAKPPIRAISNPLHEPDDVDEELDPQEELENRLNEVMHKGPNTPPEPPNSPPSSPDVYDPFDPTKSRSPTPEPMQANLQAVTGHNVDSTQKDISERTAVGETLENGNTPTNQIINSSKSHTPPLPTSDIQPADSHSTAQAVSPDTNVSGSPERPISVVINQVIQSQASIFPTVISKPLASTAAFVSSVASLITSTPASTSMPAPRINLLSSAILNASNVTSSLPQRIVLPTPTKSSPVNKVSPCKTPIKSTPIKPMPSKNVMIKLPSTSAKTSWKIRNRNEGNDANLDFESPYSPGSSDYEDLFEPPPESTKTTGSTAKSSQLSKHTKAPTKLQSAFDVLFGSSPIYKTKCKAKLNKMPTKFKKKPVHILSKGTKQVGVKLDEDNLKIMDELPNSAVELQVKDKFLKKLNRQERVVEEVKFVLKPHYNKKRISKEEYKDILRRAVPKICHNKSGEINPKKIQLLIEAYVKKVRHSKKVTSSSSVHPQKT